MIANIMTNWLTFFFLFPLTLWGMGETYDVVIYGGNSAGIIAAIQCARMGKSVVLIAPNQHLGGMTINGLSCVDVTDPALVGGLTHEFFHNVWLHYLNPINWRWEKFHFIESQANKHPLNIETMWLVEPHVAEQIFNSMLLDSNVVIEKEERLERKMAVSKKNQNIVQIVMESGKVFSGKIFIDASYEGDLMAAAGISYVVGREPNSLYNERRNGIRPKATMDLSIDPYIIPGNTKSGLLPRVFDDLGGETGQGDYGVQAYNYRICLTDLKSNAIKIEKPENYDEFEYELIFRALNSRNYSTNFFKQTALPNKKIDANHSGTISTDYVGMSWDYPEADYDSRDQIAKKHEQWQRGLLWTLQNHPRVPKKIRRFYASWGLPKDEFIDNHHWPYELYVREGRRMVSDYIITENTVFSSGNILDSIGVTSYFLDSHAIKYYVDERGLLRTDGGIYQKIQPFSISYRAIVPRRVECLNLLVPVCLSASHVAFSAIRMEPIFMILGQSAATAACLAIDLKCSVQDVSYKLLKKQLLEDQQILARH